MPVSSIDRVVLHTRSSRSLWGTDYGGCSTCRETGDPTWTCPAAVSAYADIGGSDAGIVELDFGVGKRGYVHVARKRYFQAKGALYDRGYAFLALCALWLTIDGLLNSRSDPIRHAPYRCSFSIPFDTDLGHGIDCLLD